MTICNGDGGYAGGIVNGYYCEVYILECAITGNSGDVAGGIFNQSSELILDMCLIAGNVARGCGGGVLNYDAGMVAYDCTFSGNSLAAGGYEGVGLYNFGAYVVMFNTTVANNSAGGLPVSRGGGMASYLTGIAVLGSIFAANPASVAGTGNAYYDSSSIVFEAFNIDSENTCGFSHFTSQVNTDPLIGPLQDNGGPTNTHAISPDSPALDKGFPGDYIDQRGVARPQGLANDIGAFELEMHNTNVRINARGGTGPEEISFSSSSGGIFNLTAWPSTACAKSLPDGMIYPYGLFSFRVVSIVPGSQVRITIKFPRVIPATFQYFKCGPNGLINITSLVTHNPGDDFIVLTLTDGGPGDMDGIINGKISDPGGPAWVINPAPQSSSSYIAPPQKPVSLPALSVQKATLSAAEVKPGEPVTVTASVVNKGGAKGAIKLSLYVNGEEEAVQGLTVESGGNIPVSFTLSRSEPGVYSVYLGGTFAGEFKVSGVVNPDIMLVISMALVLTSLVMGLLLLYRRQYS